MLYSTDPWSVLAAAAKGMTCEARDLLTSAFNTHLVVVSSNTKTRKHFSGAKINGSHKGMIPLFMLTFLIHFLLIQLALPIIVQGLW